MKFTVKKSIAVEGEMDLKKGVHDAMMHHAKHARAADLAGKKDEAKKHTFMFMRHAVENSRDARSPYAMVQGMKDNLSHFDREASDKISWEGDHPLVKHFKGGGEYQPHDDDSKFTEDYDDADGPDSVGDKKKKGKKMKKSVLLELADKLIKARAQ